MVLVECATLRGALVLRFQLQHGHAAHEVLHLLSDGCQRPVSPGLPHPGVQAVLIGRRLHALMVCHVSPQHVHALQQPPVHLLALRVLGSPPPVVLHQRVVLAQLGKFAGRLCFGPCCQVVLHPADGLAAVACAQCLAHHVQCLIGCHSFLLSCPVGPATGGRAPRPAGAAGCSAHSVCRPAASPPAPASSCSARSIFS